MSSLRVLFVDDEWRSSYTIERDLRVRFGFEVIMAQAPKEALQRIAQSEGRPFDVLLLDVMMEPDDSVDESLSDQGVDTGILLLEKLNEIPAAAGIPVVILSARDDLDMIPAVVNDQRVKSILVKPELSVTIAKALKKAVSGEGAET